MSAEMAEQPAVLSGLAERRSDLVRDLRAVVPDDFVGVVLIARGSSDHAAVYGRYVLEVAGGRPVGLAAPSLYTLYGARVDYRGYLAVAVSQSGRTPEIVSVLERARAAGARTVGITNDPGSPLALAADVVVDLGAGEEKAVPATKTFTAQLAGFAMLAEALGEVPWREKDWGRLPPAVEAVLADHEPARDVAAAIEGEGLITVARGYLYGVALEAALKIKETSGLLAEGYSAADLRHGPVAVVERGFPVLAFSAGGVAARDMAELVQMLIERGARVFEARQDEEAELPVPPDPSEPLAAIPMAVRAQQVAHAVAMHRGQDPDGPAGLSKVTYTS